MTSLTLTEQQGAAEAGATFMTSGKLLQENKN
jgi:hypothetical protein